MKRFLIIALAAMLVLGLCACAESDPAGTTAPGNTPSGPVGYRFTYNGYQFGVGMAMKDVKLGEPLDKAVSESCAFGGQDTVYYYGSIQVSTNDEEGYEKVYSIYLEDDLVSTEKGISIGATPEQVKAAYGEPDAVSTENCLIYGKDGMKLRFNINNGKVSSIIYDTLP